MSAYEESMKRVTGLAGADLSASQYCFVKINSSKQLALCGSGDYAYGILQDKPSAAGRAAEVCIGGTSKVLFGGTVVAGQPVVSDANGKAVAAGSGDAYSLGIAVEGGANGELHPVTFNPIGLT